MAKHLEVNDEMRKKISEANAEALKSEGLNPDTVEVWEDGYRTAKQDNAFEWWYFDAHFEDKSTCVITFNTKPNTKPSGPIDPSVLFITRSSEGKRRSAIWKGAASDFDASTEGCDVRVGPSWVKGDLETYELHAEADGMSVDLSIKRIGPSWRPGAAITYLDPDKKKYFAWVVPVPYGMVEGELEIDGNRRKVKGTVYHDHNWGNFLLSKMLDHWYWGRAHVGDCSIIFAQLTTAGILGFGALKLHTFFFSKGNEILTDDGLPLHLVASDFTEGPSGRKYPRRLEFKWEAEEGFIKMSITNPRLIESIDLLEDQPLWTRPFIHLIMNPWYYDFDADLMLEYDIKGVKGKEKGNVIYEQMLFHKKMSKD